MTVSRGRAAWVRLALALGAVALAGAVVAAPTYRVEGNLTHAVFGVDHFGVFRFEGRFERVSGTIVLDPSTQKGSVEFILDATSVNTGWDTRDAFIRSDHMFDVARYPSLRFRSNHLVWEAGALRAVDGEFTLRDVTRPLRLEVRDLQCAGTPAPGHESCRALVVGRISRAEFGMTYAYPIVGDEVEFVFTVTATRISDD